MTACYDILHAGHVQFFSDARVARAVSMSYDVQRDEGMEQLPDISGSLCRKYCGGGWGGYALYLFPDRVQRDALTTQENHLPVEPYVRRAGE